MLMTSFTHSRGICYTSIPTREKHRAKKYFESKGFVNIDNLKIEK